MRIGLLCGRERSFPEAFLEALSKRGGPRLRAFMLELGGTADDETWACDVIVDRISHEVPYYRTALKQAALEGVRVVNNPFWCAADDKFFGYALARKLGLAVPRTIALPNKDYSERVSEETLGNLRYPMDWKALADAVGLPAFLKPANGGGWRDVNKVYSVEELLYRYDQSGTDTMVLQEAVTFDEYLRCFCIGRRDVVVARYEVEERRYDPEVGGLDRELLARVEREALTITRALGYDVNTVEFAIRDGIPWAIDFTNFAPDMERESLGDSLFLRVVDAMVSMSLRLAEEVRQARSEDPIQGFLAPPPAPGRGGRGGQGGRGGRGRGRAPAPEGQRTDNRRPSRNERSRRRHGRGGGRAGEAGA